MQIGNVISDHECVARLRNDIQAALNEHDETKPVQEHADRLANRLLPEIAAGKYTTTTTPEQLRKLRDAHILADFTGRNHDEVLAKHKISRRLLYFILSRSSRK